MLDGRGAAAAALGSLADAVVVRDLSTAVMALTTLRSENLGQADFLVLQSGDNRNIGSIPSDLIPLISHMRSSQIDGLLRQLLATTVVADDARQAESIIRAHSHLSVVTRDGDAFTQSRARGGSKSTASLIEIKALIDDLTGENFHCHTYLRTAAF